MRNILFFCVIIVMKNEISFGYIWDAKILCSSFKLFRSSLKLVGVTSSCGQFSSAFFLPQFAAVLRYPSVRLAVFGFGTCGVRPTKMFNNRYACLAAAVAVVMAVFFLENVRSLEFGSDKPYVDDDVGHPSIVNQNYVKPTDCKGHPMKCNACKGVAFISRTNCEHWCEPPCTCANRSKGMFLCDKN